MRKAILLMLPFAVPTLVVVAFALAETGRPIGKSNSAPTSLLATPPWPIR